MCVLLFSYICSLVHSLLYQIITYAILSPVLGNYVDLQVRYVTRGDGFSSEPTDIQYRTDHVHYALLNVGGVHFTVLSGMILVASLIPHGALRLNPQIISDKLGNDFEEVYSPEHLRLGKTHPISEKDGYASSVAATEPATEPDLKHEASFDASFASPSSPTSPIGPDSPDSLNGPDSSSLGVFNSADDRERERERVLRRQRSGSLARERRPKSASATPREQQPVFETRVHMPTGIRVDLNVSARALPIPPPPPPPSSNSPNSPSMLRPHPHF